MPMIVIRAENDSNSYVVIDAYKRMAALEQLRRDTVEAIVWDMSEAEPLLLERSLRFSRQELRWNKAGCCRRWRATCWLLVHAVLVREVTGLP